ncbi:MAG: DHH family phosphoesterase [Bacteroidaceae bacterium]|nr:DHH family phosphoesterase [Bacteroidaceae bacterium]
MTTLAHILSDVQQQTLQQLVDEARNVVVCCHQNPDGDAIGSMAAATLLMRRLGKKATAIMPNRYPDFLAWIPMADEMLAADSQEEQVNKALAEADLVFLLDFNTLSRMAQPLCGKVSGCTAPRVLIDHHLSPDADCQLTISHPEMCSTCEVLLRVMSDMGWTEGLTAPEATAIYTGMMTDTGNFAYASNRPEIYVAISILLQTGIDKDRIYRNVFYTHNEGRFRLLGYLLYVKMEIMNELHTALITLTNEERSRFKVKNGATEGFVNMPLEMEGMRLSIFLREDTEEKGLIRVSTRSLDDFPCNELCAEFFNGGGHKNASGGSLHMTMDEAIEVVHRAVMAYKEKLKD